MLGMARGMSGVDVSFKYGARVSSKRHARCKLNVCCLALLTGRKLMSPRQDQWARSHTGFLWSLWMQCINVQQPAMHWLFQFTVDEAYIVLLPPSLLPFPLHILFDTFQVPWLESLLLCDQKYISIIILHDPKRQFDQLIYRSKRDSFALMLITLALRDFISQYIYINGTAIGPINAFCGNDWFQIFLLAIECLPAREAPLSICSRNPVRCDHYCYDRWPHLRCALLFSHLGWSGISKGEEARPRSEERRRATELSASSIHGATNR